MRVRSAVVFVLLVSLFTLTPLAHGSPVDPTWIQGIYDDADFDDVVVWLTVESALQPEPLPRVTLLPLAAGLVEPGDGPTRSTAALPSSLGRAPPGC